MDRPIKSTVTGLARYNGRQAQTSFILHRLTGIATVLFLAIHIVDTATVYFFPSLYQHAIELYRSIPFALGELVLVFCLCYHGVNGLRIALFDLVFTDQWKKEGQNNWLAWTLLISFALWVPAAVIMFYNMMEHLPAF